MIPDMFPGLSIDLGGYSRLPATGKPFCFILYTDKTNLSSFGMEKGYQSSHAVHNFPMR